MHRVGLLCWVASLAMCVVSCGRDERFVRITSVGAVSPTSNVLHLVIDGCSTPAPLPAPRVVETATEVHLRLDVKLDFNNMKLCISGGDATLDRPIADRVVIDDRTGRRFKVGFP